MKQVFRFQAAWAVCFLVFWSQHPAKAQTAPTLTFYLAQDKAVVPFATGANAAKWMESLTFHGTAPEGLGDDASTPGKGKAGSKPPPRNCFIQPSQIDYYRQSFSDLAPFTLRFPGGGDQSQFIHFSDSLSGFGFDLRPGGELFQYMIKKDPLEWSRKKAEQLALPEGCSYLNSFLELASLNNEANVIYTANVVTSHPLEQFYALNKILEAGLALRGVEMGNELYAFRVWDWPSFDLKYWYDPAHGGRAAAEYLRSLQEPHTYCQEGTCFDMSFVSMVDSLERKFGVSIPIGLTAAPPEQGNETIYLPEETRQRFLDWNDTLASVRDEPWVDAYIVHLYARQLRIPCDLSLAPIENDSVFTDQELDEAFACLEASLKAYFGPLASYPLGDHLQRHVRGMADDFAATSGKVNELWLTEWGLELADRYDVALISNTFLEAVFTQRWLHEMLRNNAGLKQSHPGIQITAVTKQLLTGSFENSIVGPRNSWDARYAPDPGATGRPWGLGSSKSPDFVRRTPYWPMAFVAELLQQENLKAVRVEGLAPDGPLQLYAYESDDAARDSRILQLYFSWADSIPYRFDTREQLALNPAFKEPLPLSAWTFRQAEMNWLDGHALHASAGYSKHAEIASKKNPAAPLPDYDYGWYHSETSDSNSFWLPPYSFGRITLHLRTADPRLAGHANPQPDTLTDQEANQMPGEEPHRQANLQVWPNPAREILHYRLVQGPVNPTEPAPPRLIELRDLTGAVVKRWFASASQGELSISQLPDGLYTLHTPGEPFPSTIKLVILPR
jgi:hypothetical protein